MTRKEIGKAAVEYADSINMIYGSKENIIEDFIAGAEWRINSVWHDAKEKPNGMFVIVIDFGDEVGEEEYGFGVTADDLEGAKRWAYVSDLLPERKEEAE